MPYDYFEDKYYDFSYVKFRKILKEKSDILFCESYSNKFCDLWINCIKNIDCKIKRKYENNKDEMKYILCAEGEIFRKQEIFDDQYVYYYYRISYLRKILKDIPVPIQTVKTKEFTRKNSIINWEYEKVADKKMLKKEPIIIVYYPTEGYEYIVIDGNHRLSYAIDKKKRKIKTYCLSAEFILKNDVLLTDFEKAFLTLKLELFKLYEYKLKNKHITDKELLSKSFIYSQ